MKHKILGAIISTVLAVTSSIAIAGPLEDRVKAGKTIRLGFAAAAPWAHPGEKGEPIGFVNVITVDVLKKMGYTNIEPVVTDWSGLIPSLMAGRVDLITGGMYILAKRCENIDFSEPIGEFGNAFIVAKGNPQGLKTYEDIKKAGVVMAGVAGYSNIEQAQQAGVSDSNIMQLPGITEVLAAVKSGRAAIGAMTSLEANDLQKKNDGVEATDPRALPKWAFNWVGIGFHPDDDTFRADFNAKLRDGYLGSEQMMADVAEFDYTESNVPDDTTTAWACANR